MKIGRSSSKIKAKRWYKTLMIFGNKKILHSEKSLLKQMKLVKNNLFWNSAKMMNPDFYLKISKASMNKNLPSKNIN